MLIGAAYAQKLKRTNSSVPAVDKNSFWDAVINNQGSIPLLKLARFCIWRNYHPKAGAVHIRLNEAVPDKYIVRQHNVRMIDKKNIQNNENARTKQLVLLN